MNCVHLTPLQMRKSCFASNQSQEISPQYFFPILLIEKRHLREQSVSLREGKKIQARRKVASPQKPLGSKMFQDHFRHGPSGFVGKIMRGIGEGIIATEFDMHFWELV